MPAKQTQPVDEIVASADLSPDAAALWQQDMPPEAFVAALEKAGQSDGALRFLAQWLPKREAIWWGCQCFWHVYRPAPVAADDAVLRAVVAWVFEPSEERRRLAEQVGSACGRKSAARYLASATFYCEGSISGPNLPEVLPSPALSGSTLFAALMLLATQVPYPDVQAFFRQCVHLGLELARGRTRWDGGQPAVPPSGAAVAYAEPDVEETPAPVIAALLQFAKLTPRDVVYNLGCGDGRLLISAASKHGVRGVGIDSKPAAVEAARDNVRKARLQKLVTIDAGNPPRADLSPATVVFLVLSANQNAALKDTLQRQLRAGARVITHQGGLAAWQPDEETVVQDPEGRSYRFRLWRMHGRAAAPPSSITDVSGTEWDSSAG